MHKCVLTAVLIHVTTYMHNDSLIKSSKRTNKERVGKLILTEYRQNIYISKSKSTQKHLYKLKED